MNITSDKGTTLIHDLIKDHEYEITVVAIGPDGTRQPMEEAARNTIIIRGKLESPSTPSGLTATGFLNAIMLSWTNPANYDLSHAEVWRSTINYLTDASKIADVTGGYYLDTVGSSGLTYYYWVKAVNTSGKASGFFPSITEGVEGTSLGVDATDIDDFAITATKMFTNTIVLTADSWSDNSPGGGSVAWNAHSIVYNGASYPITAGNTALAYIYWIVGDTTYSTSATHPALGTTAFMIAINTAGIHTLVWNSSANMVIGTAFIANLAVTNAKIVSLSATKLTAGTIDASVITVTNLDADNIVTGTLSVSRLSFTPTDNTNVVAIINASSEGINIEADNIEIRGTTTFFSGWAAAGNAESDINVLNTTNAPADASATDDTVANTKEDAAGVTTIVGNTITTGYVDALEITVLGAVTAGSLTGLTVQTAAADKRVVLSGVDNNIIIYDSSGTAVIRIDDTLWYAANPGIQIKHDNGVAYITNAAEDKYVIISSNPLVTVGDESGALKYAQLTPGYIVSMRSASGVLFKGLLGAATVFSVDTSGNVVCDDIDLDGSITMDANETVDGIDISAHAANNDAHHAESHAITAHTGTLTIAKGGTNRTSFTASRVVVVDATGAILVHSGITTTELNYLNNVNANVRTHMDNSNAHHNESHTLGSHSDVDISSPQTNEDLTYIDPPGVWRNI